MYKVIFDELPALNEYLQVTRSRYGYSANIKRKFTNKCKQSFLTQLANKKLEYPYEFIFVWYAKDKRKDPDNICFAHKFIFDGMQTSGLMKNDNWAHIIGFEDFFLIDKKNPRVEMLIAKPNEYDNLRQELIKKEMLR